MCDTQLLEKVLFIGPDLNGKGGISSVLHMYYQCFPEFHYIPSNSRKGTMAGAVQLGKLMLRLPFERLRGRRILHLHGCMGKSWTRKTLIMRWGKLFGFKTIFHCHGGTAKEFFKEYGIERARKILDKYDAVIGLSKGWADYFAETFGIRDKTFYVNNIVLPGQQPLNLKYDGTERFLFLGEICDSKGLFDILHAMAQSDLKNMSLHVGGNGEVERFKREVAKLGLTDRVFFHGWVTGEKKEMLLRHSNVMILPSYNEGMPITILEAMAWGKGIIASPVGGIPELIENNENGFLVNPGNTEEIAAAMNKYIADSKLFRIHGIKSLQKIQEFYPGQVLESLCNIYSRILE